MPTESTDRGRQRCIPTQIYTDVVKARVEQDGMVLRKIHVFKDVRDIDFCAAETLHARVSVKEDGWAVSAAFKVVVGFDPHRHERIVKTIVFFRTHIPFPSTSPPRPVDFRKLEAKVKIADLACHASVGEDERVIIAELTFRVIVVALEDEIITVCRLRGNEHVQD